MKLKPPPVVIFLIVAIAMYGLAKFLPVGYFDFFGRLGLMWVFIALAGLTGLLALIQFYKAKTTIDPRHPSKTTTLVRNGIYTISRNPMYLALLLLLLAWGLWLGNAFNTLLAAAFVSAMNRLQIRKEEAALLQQFGREYEQYCSQTRRWF